MRITINGSPLDVDEGCRLPWVLASLGLEGKPCAVEVNAVVVPKADHAACTMHAGDVIEIVTLVGGG